MVPYFDRYEGAEYQSGRGHSRAVTVIEDALLAAGVPLSAIRHNVAQKRGRDDTGVTREGRPDMPLAKPDISYWDPVAQQRVNVEVDTTERSSRAHQTDLRQFDPNSRNIFLVIHPQTGEVRSKRIDDPARSPGRTPVLRSPVTLANLLTGRPSTRIYTNAHMPAATLTSPPRRAAPRPAAPPVRPPRSRPPGPSPRVTGLPRPRAFVGQGPRRRPP